MAKLILFLVSLVWFQTVGQTRITGKVIDEITKEPLAFANITFNFENKLYTSTDIDGNFSFTSTKTIEQLSCTYVGYDKMVIDIDYLTSSNPLFVQLKQSTNVLNEVLVHPQENPANRIVRKVIDNKEINNPENIASFKYQCYNKMVYDFTSVDKTDSINIRRKLNDSHLFLLESVTEKKYIKPNFSEEKIIGTRVSGFKNPTFAALATDIQPFSFYQDNIKLFNIYYLNPISKGALNKYKFKLEETIILEKDTVFVISYRPIVKKNFDGLEGILQINSNKYAIQNVIAYPHEKGKISLKIQQKYQLIDHLYWFPEQLNYYLILSEYPNKNIGITSNGRSYISKIDLNIPIDKKSLSNENVWITDDATQKDTVFWNVSRKEKLNLIEKKTYQVLDSIGQKKHYDYYLTLLEKLVQRRIPISFFDIDLAKTLVVNQYEGFRIGTGFFTNESLFKDFTIGGFFGYGSKDGKWKYGLNTEYMFSKKNEFTLEIAHQNNLAETGNYGLNSFNNSLLNLRPMMAYQFDEVTQNSLILKLKTLRSLKWRIAFNQTKTIPLYDYEFRSYNKPLKEYKNSNFSLFLRFAFKEKLVKSFGTTFSTGTKYPIFYFNYSKGFDGVLNGDLNYNKIEFAIEQYFYSKNLGQTKYRIEGGFIDRSLPYGMLFTGEGSDSKNLPYVTKNTFQSMELYEFLSDRYANIFLSHNFGTLLFKVNVFQPNFSLHHNMGWGQLPKSTNHSAINFNTKENVFLETGLQFDNVIKLNIMNLGYFGLGTAAFYRYGFYSNPTIRENIAYKLTLSYTIK